MRPAAGADAPDRLVVFGRHGRTVRSWPLPVLARRGTLQVSWPLAAYSALGGHGLWVTRLTDGRTTFVAPVRAGDRPLLDAHGVVYEDNVYKHAAADRPLLKFVPTPGLQGELAQVGRSVHTGAPIRSISMDGNRVALAVGGTSGCDGVWLWNIPWRSFEQVSETAGPSCSASGASHRISGVALGGSHIQWVTYQHGRAALLAADDIGCKEWVIDRLSDHPGSTSLAAFAAHGATLAFALVQRTHAGPVSLVGGVAASYRASSLYRVPGAARALSVDGYRTALLTTDGRVDVRGYGGRTFRSFRARSATMLALRGRIVAATAGRRLDVYSVSTGRRLHSWRLPAGTRPRVDVEYGIAVVTAGRSVYAMRLATGRTARLAVAPAAVRAQIGSAGVVYAYSAGRGGTAAFVPMSTVEAALR